MSYFNVFKGNVSFDSRIRVLRKRVLESDLVNAVNGSPVSIAMRPESLPAGAVILGRSINVATLFTGGGATSVVLTVGYPTQLGAVASLEVNNTTATGKSLQGAAGASPAGPALASQVPQLTFTPDGAHNLSGLTAGDLTVELYYSVADEHLDRT
jgi:hypothetical protein